MKVTLLISMVISEGSLTGAVDTGVVVKVGVEWTGAGAGGAGASLCGLDAGTAGRMGVKFGVDNGTLALGAGSFFTLMIAPG